MPEQQPPRQAFLFRHRAFACAALLVLLVPLSGCGKKPANVDPPPGVENDMFPHVYPDPATDPKP